MSDKEHLIMATNKVQLLQEARVFNQSPINPRKCRVLLTKVTYLLEIGETFTEREATDLFFGITKLFQHKDIALRQMVYVVIKKLSGLAQDVIMVTSSIMKDTQSTADVIYRPNALRALCRIIDGTTVQVIERLIKTCIVDWSPAVSSAALISSYHLFPLSKDIVRRWANETQEALLAAGKRAGSSGPSMLGVGSGGVGLATLMTQYHAIGLLYLMRSHDRLAITRLVQQFSGSNNPLQALKSSHGLVMLCRYAAKILGDDPNLRKPMLTILHSWLRNRSDMVNLEAARMLCEIPDITDEEVLPAISTLSLFLSSPRIICRFAAIRMLNKFAMHRPILVNACNVDIEALITDSNRSIATYAITTLLKTGNEASVDRLMKQITGFMSDITDEFKIIVVDAIRNLCLKFPAKQSFMLEFLSGCLRDDGGYAFKAALVEAILDLIKFIPESREMALLNLCEFIEDCEFTRLAVRILHLLGVEGPKSKNSSKYIRHIYNRIILENAAVRAAAVTALAKFGAQTAVSSVKSSVRVLLTRCLEDPDDEVRDRAAFSLKMIDSHVAEVLIKNENMYAMSSLEHKLVLYISQGDFSKPIDISDIPIITREEADAIALKTHTETFTPQVVSVADIQPATHATAPETVLREQTQKKVFKIPEFQAYGNILKVCPPVPLTEAETEYGLSVTLYLFAEHLVMQYTVINRIPESVMENVSVLCTPDAEQAFSEDFIITARQVDSLGEPGLVYVSFRRNNPSQYEGCSFTNIIKFNFKEIDPSTGKPEQTGYDEEYEAETYEFVPSDYLIPAHVSGFSSVWEGLGQLNEISETFELSSYSSIQDACRDVLKMLSLQPLDGSDNPVSSTTHTAKVYGSTLDDTKVAAILKFAYSVHAGVLLQVTVRSGKPEASDLVIQCIQ